jgi:23S rRNA (adenine2503-C2)-methyltransferase
MADKFVLTGKTKEELAEFFAELGEPKFRAKQLFDWIYDKRVFDFDEMKNLPKSLRKKLSENAEIFSLHSRGKMISDSTGTQKYLLMTNDNRAIEAVIIPEGKRTTLCVSTQVGCPLDCKFCATGLMGFKRNLTTSEIVDQYLLLQKDYDKQITNIVFMGMGEPLLNYENTIKAIEIFIAEETRGLSKNRITVSTAGIPPKIIALAESGLRVKIALSLHRLSSALAQPLRQALLSALPPLLLLLSSLPLLLSFF